DIALRNKQTASAQSWLAEIRAIEGEQGWLWRCAEAALLVQQSRGNRSRLDEARARLQEVEKTHKDLPRVALLLGTIAELEGNHEQAMEQYARARGLGETQPRALATRLGLLVQRRDFARAKTELAKYEKRQPLTADLARLGAEVALAMREPHF